MTSHDQGLSQYELERARNIAENAAALCDLGLKKLKLPADVRSKRKREVHSRTKVGAASQQDVAVRRSSRARRSVALYSQQRSGGEGDSSGDSSADEYHPDPDDLGRADAPPARRKRARPPAAASGSGGSSGDDSLDDAPTTAVVVVEPAKTGRSKCRKCFEQLGKGELRVGMESWMVGRQVQVWQHPGCFLQQVSVTMETTGRGKCKQTKAPFAKGEHKLTFCAHSTTAHFTLDAGGALLAPVLAAAVVDTPLRDVVKGHGDLSAEDAAVLEAAVALARVALERRVAGSSADADADADAGSSTSASPASKPKVEGGGQPVAGSVANATGRVAWRWAGRLCYGKLISRSETKTHCYARTQKGNTKTLTKGGAYWWQL